MEPLTPVQLRHKLHQYPEIAFQESRTTSLLIQNIKMLPNSDAIKIHTPLDTGLLVEYKNNDGEYFLFRADIDALPIHEENEIEFKSTNEFMHACGHDVHTSILYSFLKEILEKQIDKNLLFLFQPAEEAGGGAMKFYETGIFNNYKIRNAFALHVTDEYSFGTVASTPGVLFASALEIDIEFIGESAHIAFPGEGRNAFNAMRKFLSEAEELFKEINEPFIFGVGKVESGFVRNIAPGYAKLEGSIRGTSMRKVNDVISELENILNKIKEKTGVDFRINKGAHYPEVDVDEDLFKSVRKILSGKYDFIDCGLKMTGEDFGFFSHRWHSFMFWLGASKGEKFGLHNPGFLPPDETIELGKNVFKEILLNI